jgi:hypothetical protein
MAWEQRPACPIRQSAENLCALLPWLTPPFACGKQITGRSGLPCGEIIESSEQAARPTLGYETSGPFGSPTATLSEATRFAPGDLATPGSRSLVKRLRVSRDDWMIRATSSLRARQASSNDPLDSSSFSPIFSLNPYLNKRNWPVGCASPPTLSARRIIAFRGLRVRIRK